MSPRQKYSAYSDYLLNAFRNAVFNAGNFEIFTGNEGVKNLLDSSVLLEVRLFDWGVSLIF